MLNVEEPDHVIKTNASALRIGSSKIHGILLRISRNRSDYFWELQAMCEVTFPCESGAVDSSACGGAFYCVRMYCELCSHAEKKSKRALKVGSMWARCTRIVMEPPTRRAPWLSFLVAQNVCCSAGALPTTDFHRRAGPYWQ